MGGFYKLQIEDWKIGKLGELYVLACFFKNQCNFSIFQSSNFLIQCVAGYPIFIAY